MAGYQFAFPANFRTPSNWLTSGADSTFTEDNLEVYTDPWRPAKSSGNVSTSTYFGADFGSAVALAAVAVDNINISSIKIQASSAATFDANLIDSGAITVGQNPIEALPQYPLGGRYKHLFLTAGTDFDGATRRYWRVLSNASARVPFWDGPSDTGTNGVLLLGSIVWVNSLTTLASGSSSYDETPLEATLTNENFVGGGAQPVITGNPHGAFSLGAAPASRSAMRADILNVLRHGVGRWMLFHKNDSDLAEFYICRRAADVTLSQDSPTTFRFAGMTFQTAV